MATFDIATPAGGDSPTEADDRMREIKAAIQERLAVEHHFDLVGTEVPAGGDTGKHTDITSDSIVNVGDVATATLTATGDASVGGDAAITGGASVGGDATVGGTLDVTGIATVAKGSLLASSDAPTTDAMIANKKYVDDNIETDPAYAGGESHTFAGGLIIKFGSYGHTSGTQTVTFGTAFPNALMSAFVQMQVNADVSYYAPNIKTASTSAISIGLAASVTMNWFAIGY